MKHWKEFLTGVSGNPLRSGIETRQVTELKKYISSLYTLLCVNTCALSFTHYAVAPAWMTLGMPGLLVAICALRAVHWWRLQPHDLAPKDAVRQLRATSLLTAVLSAAFVTWAIGLGRYGGPFEQGHVAIFVAVTVVACIFCLTHLPVAAFLVTVIVMGVFLVHHLTSGNHVFVAIALNTAFVTAVMVRILADNFLTFIRLVEAQARAERLADENARVAHTDGLTGLPNRRFFFQRLDGLLEEAAGTDAPFGLAILDLDRFKPINDTYGHTAGDRVLTEIARRLSAFAGPDITAARLGGDEFGLLIRPSGPEDEVIAVCNRICEALRAPIRVGETQVVADCSCGLALYPSAGRSADVLFDRADYALYHAKEHLRGAATLFSREHEDAIRAELAVETALLSADLAAEMEVYYQPILDTATDAVALVEGLARWTSPVLGRVPPDRFIAAAERSGIIHTVTTLLLRKALADATRLPPEVGLSFNLSSHNLASSETVCAILAAVRESGLDPRRLTLELTETALMRDFERARDAIATLRALGIQIALDDFGTGYSSLGYVHRLPLDKIKIDRSFMADIQSDLGRSVVVTILDLCQNLGLDCIAEGVETGEQLAAARRHGCRYAQGHLLGMPMPLDELLSRLRSATAGGRGRIWA
ncbi:EAL domain-containing protein [Methylobacterium terricola]|uniref:EAL domain-containing protein n=1 Tax=Methylobacterium terricola TaxID=2583531 RepID=A0A5C4LHR6_9HYPH|nr:EAL domain-containing protein [Methylobacterium terricola]TNC12968.1 EAL domain-containing protein [Methylobacterium terricola]